MPKVRMHFMEMPRGLHLTFVEGPNAVSRPRLYVDPDKIYEILRAAKAPQEDHHAVALALHTRRPGAVELNLTQQQYDKLTRGGK
jgi:hypothetical protein